MRPPEGRTLAYILIVSIITSLMSAGFSAWNTKRSERKLCTVVVAADNAYRNNLPTTELGKEQARNFAMLRNQLGCN